MQTKVDARQASLVSGVLNLAAGLMFFLVALIGEAQKRAIWLPVAAIFLGLGVFWLNRARASKASGS